MQSPTKVVGNRVGAWIIDLLILSAVSAISWYALTKNVGGGGCIGGGVEINGKCRGFTADASGNRTAWLLINILVPIGILWVMQGITGKTPGKAIAGIKTVNAEGNPPGVGRAALRSILWIVDGFPYLIPYLTGFIVALTGERNQRVGDMAAGTFVVRKDWDGPVPAVGQLPGGAPQYAATSGWNAPPASSPTPPPPQPQMAGAQAADWYPDPQGQARLRYWDGQRWTDHTSA
jgi:uncharacterized RDD family membrane protein YckC